MSKREFVMDQDFKMKVINCLKNYGEYGGVLSNNEISKKYVSGEIRLVEAIQSKWEFKVLKAGVNSVLDYCYENSFREIEDVMKYFYKVECMEVRKKYGGFFDRH